MSNIPRSAPNQGTSSSSQGHDEGTPNILKIRGVTQGEYIMIEFLMGDGENPSPGSLSNQVERQATQVRLNLKAACLSNVWSRHLRELVQNPQGALIQAGSLVVRSQMNQAQISERTLTALTTYLNYHSMDAEFESSCFIDDFEEDIYENEHKRLQEPPCFWDWVFITNLGGGKPTMSQEHRGHFYDLMIVAHALEISSLLELGSKYIVRQLSMTDLATNRQILGLSPLNPAEEARINQENDPIFNKIWKPQDH